MNMEPKGNGSHRPVSVIITCYNYGRYLKECIESVLAQTVQGLEIIVVNDGSTDETETICKSFGESIRYHAQPNRGLAEALNNGIEMSHGDFFYYLSADDKLFPETIERQLEVMEEDETCAVVCGNAKMIDEKGRFIGDNINPFPEKNGLLRMLGTPNLHDGSLLFRRASLEKINALYFDPSLGNYHIYHYKCFLLARGFRIRYLNEFLVYQRVHPFNLSHPQHAKRMIAGYEILRKEMRKHVTVFDLFEGVDREDPEEVAKAYYKLGTLFFLFGQYGIAYDDFKRASDLAKDIFEKEVDISELNFGQYVFPLPVKNIQVQDEKARRAVEREKGPEAKEIIAYLERGNVAKAFFVCKEKLEREPSDSEAKYLLAKTYLRQLQFHDSANRFHEVTLGLLKEVQAEAPLHSIDLYLWLGFLDEERRDDYFNELSRRMGRMKLYDVKEMAWAASNAKAKGKTEWLERGMDIFNQSGLTPGALKEANPPPVDRSLKRKRDGRKRVLLVNPPHRRFLGLEAPCFPLSFGYMATLIEEQGYEVGIYDAEYDRRLVGKTGSYEYALTHQSRINEALKDGKHIVWSEIGEMIQRFAPDIVGISAMSNKYPMVERIAEITKSIDQAIPVVIGGHHPSIYGGKLIRNRNIDFVVRGEGEMTMKELVHRFFAPRKDLSEVKGLLYKERGEIRTNPPRELIQDLDLLPIPNRNLILNDHYVSGNNVMTARGCPFHCSYCGARVIWERKVRRRSVERVLKEIRGLIQRSGSRSISFWDDSFTCDRHYLGELMKGLWAIDGLTFSCITRLDLVDKEILNLLREAGCNQILFGIESGSDRILKSIQKGMSRDLIRKKVEEVNSFGIPWLGFFIMGYPGETKEDILETLHFMKELDPPAAEINLFNPLPGTPIWNELEGKGLVDGDMDFSQYSQSSLKNYFLSGLSQEEFEGLALRMTQAFDEHNQRKQDEAKCVSGVKKIETATSPIQKGEKISSIQPMSAPGFTPILPKQVHFLMIDKCNAKCIMCGGDYYHSRSGRMITLETFKQMASNLRLEHFNSLVLSGAGDPLLNPWLIPIIEYVHTSYPQVAIAVTTNGIALSAALAETLLACRIDSINFSINAASPDVYKRVMQVDCFDRVCRNAREFVQLRNSRSLKTRVQFSMALHRLNIGDLPRLVEIGREIGIDSINVMYCRFYPERIRHLNIDREEDRLLDHESLFYHQELSDQWVEKAKELANRYGISFSHEPLFRERAKAQPCRWPFSEIMIGFDGEIYPCGGAEVHFREKVERGLYHFGNALKESIESFWNGEDYRLLRLSCQMEGRGPVSECERCANRINSNEKRAHLMDWDDPGESKDEHGKERVARIGDEETGQRGPLVSVIVPTHNRPEMLTEALRSILDQTYPNYEIIVVNDAGTDVENVVMPFNQAQRVTYVKHGRNLGLAAARNTGLKLARGKYIAYLDDDDLYYPDHLETLVHGLLASGFKVAYTDAYRAHQKREGGRYVITHRDVPYSFDFDGDRMLVGNFIPVLCVMHERSCLDEVGGFDEELSSHEDWDLWIRVSRKHPFLHLKKITCEFSWREDGTTMTSGRKEDYLGTRERIYEKYGKEVAHKPDVRQAQQRNLAHYRQEVSLLKSKDDRKALIEKGFEGMNAEEAYRAVQKIVEEGKGEEALSVLETFLRHDPHHALAHNDSGVLYFERGRKEEALFHLRKAFELDPKNPDILHNLGDLYVDLGQFDEGAKTYQKILSEKPEDAETLLKLRDLYGHTGHHEEAVLYSERILKVDREKGAMKGDASIHGQTDQPLRNGEDTGREGEVSVSIIIPVFNQVEYTRKCLERLYEIGSLKYRFEVIVVDNSSTDGTEEFLRQAVGRYPNLSWIRNKENLRFARACNQGARKSRGKYLVFLNNDTEPLPGWLEAGIDRLESDEGIGIVGAKLLYPDQSIQHCGIEFMRNARHDYAVWPLHRFRHAHFEDPRVNRPEEVQAVTAACLFIERQLFEEVAGITEDYGMYFEDTDLCFKVRQRGKKVFYEPKCVLIHHEGKSSPNQAIIDAFNSKAAVLFYRRWSDEVVKLDVENLISKIEGKYIHLRQEILPIPEDGPSTATRLESILWHLTKIFQSMGPFYAHFGGAGDALLLLSTFYDEKPEQTVVSIPNSPEMMKSFFESFPLLKRVYFIPFPKNYQNHLLLRRLFRILKNFKGMGVIPDPESDYFKEWNKTLNIFEKYKIVKHPRWMNRFRSEKCQECQVTLAPRGSLRGMVGSKQNMINPVDWQPLITFLNERNIHPILLGTPDEAPLYPAAGQCIDKRSFSFEEQMKLIASSDLFIGADSWGKTFSALAGVRTIVFHSMRGEDLREWKDPSDHVFLDPWEEITVVKDLSELKNAYDSLFRRDEEKPAHTLLQGRSSGPSSHSNGHFYIQRNEGLGDVLMALPSARALKHSHPESKVCFITEKRYAKVVEANPYVDRVIVAGQGDRNELTSGKFWDLNPARFGIGETHEVDAFLKEIEVEIPDSMKEIALKIPRKTHRRVEQLLQKTDIRKRGRKIVLIHPARGDMNRTWPSANWSGLSELFIKKGYGVAVVGNNSSDPARGVSRVMAQGAIHLVDQLTPLEFVSLCQRADLLVTTDSGPVQLAGGSDIAIAGIYTVIPGRCRLPYRHGKPMWKALSIEPKCGCAGCYRYMQDEKYFGPVRAALQDGSLTPIKLFSEWCVNEEKYACLFKHITPERVFEMSEGLLH